ncbi:MAG: hypothetical protein U1E45_14475 [Geminicoccaceae bacterium]
MPARRARVGALLAVLPALIGLSGCVDMFTNAAPANAPVWRGTTTADVGAHPLCAPFTFAVNVYPETQTQQTVVMGRAQPASFQGFSPYSKVVDSWWVEGVIEDNNTVLFELKQQPPSWPSGIRPYSSWRGVRVGDKIVVREFDGRCANRELTLTPG